MAEQWQLRTDDAVYGPKTREELVAWAKIGRVLPGQEISPDGERWFPVQEVPFLNIRWSIDIGDGNPRGPFHKDAAEMLLRSGRIPAESKLVETRGAFTQEETADFEAQLAPAEPPPAGEPEPRPGDGPQETAAGDDPGAAGGDAVRAEGAAPPAPAEDVQAVRAPGRPPSPAPAPSPAPTAESELIDRLEELHHALAAKDAEMAALRERLSQAGDERQRAVEAAAAKLDEALAAAAAEKEAAVAAENARGNARYEKLAAEKEAADAEWRRRYDALKAEAAAAASAAQETQRISEGKLAEAEKRLADNERAVREELRAGMDETAARAAAAEARAAAAADEIAALVKSSKSREEELRGEIEGLRGKLKQIPPDADAAASVSSAVYKLMRAEADELAAAMETERREAEAARKAWSQRESRMLARRQELLRRIGAGVEDMARIAVRERPDDPQVARLRQERETLKAEARRRAEENEARVRDLQERLQTVEAEAQRLRGQAIEADAAMRQAAAAEERLRDRENELLEERRRSAESSRRWALERQTLNTRIETLERASGISYPGGGVDGEPPRTLEVPSWMGFKS